MRFWYDTEFLEDGKTIELISFGIVAEDGRELYLVNQEIEWTEARGDLHDRICRHHWLMENVVPHLGVCTNIHQPSHPRTAPQQPGIFHVATDDNRVVPRRFIRNAVFDFLTAKGGPVELWGYYSAYDHVVLAQLFGPMASMPKGIPWWTNDVQQLAAELELEGCLPAQDASQAHNALDDARWTRKAHEYLEAQRALQRAAARRD